MIDRRAAAATLLLLLTACLANPTPTPASPVTAPAATTAAATAEPSPTPIPPTTAPTPTETATQPPLVTDTLPAPSPTVTEALPATALPAAGAGLVIDHTALALFDQLPPDVVAAAARLRAMHRAASIGENMTRGLDCLAGHFPGRSSRPNFCSQFFDPQFDRTNWSFQLRGNPGWIQKVQDFVDQANAQADDFDVFSFAVDYADGLDEGTYPAISDPENFQADYVARIEALEAAHPDKTIVWWTMSLARLGFQNEQRFNEMVRAYTRENNKILFDIADIETHSPEGVRTTDEAGLEVLYPGYTDEERSGHLNRDGRERLAKAYWVLMAHLTGWDGAAP